MKYLFFLFLSVTLFFCFCNNDVVYGEPIIKPSLILKSFAFYWDYNNKYVKLNRDFIAVDELRKTISKKEFLGKIISDGYLPLRLSSNSINQYQLYKLPESTISDIIRTIIQEANQDFSNLDVENKSIGEYNFLALDDKIYNNENTRNKVIILKCWFIGCVKCLEEFPALYDLCDKYNSNKEVVFLSLAMDNKQDLATFLIKKPLKFNVIPNQKKYLIDALKIYTYPTHVIIKNGVVLKRVNTF